MIDLTLWVMHVLGTVVKETTGGFEYVFNLFGLVTQYSLQEKKMYTLGTTSSYSSNSNDFFFTNGDTTGCRFARSGKIYLNCNSRVYSTVSESSCFYSVILNSPDYCVADTPSLTSEPTLAPVGLRNSSHAGGTNIIGTVVGMLFAISFVVGIVVCVRKIRFKSSRVHYAPNIAIELPTHGANYYRPQQPPSNMPYNNASIASAPNYPNRYEQVPTQQPHLQPQYEQPLFTSHNISGDTPYSGYPPAYVPSIAGPYRSYGQQPQQQFSAQQVVTAVAVPYNNDERAIPVATAVVIS